jgi:hypothetical protein
VNLAIDTLGTPLVERRWFNALWFQLVWLCTVLGRDTWLAAAAALLLAHLALAGDWRQEMRRLLPLALLGGAIDTTLSVTGVYQFDDGILLPAWLACLWLAFSSTFYRSLDWLGGHWWRSALAGALAMPWNYWAGSQLGAVAFGYDTLFTVCLLAIVWAVTLPLMYALAARLR